MKVNLLAIIITMAMGILGFRIQVIQATAVSNCRKEGIITMIDTVITKAERQWPRPSRSSTSLMLLKVNSRDYEVINVFISQASSKTLVLAFF
jgi:hypothetical protein